MTVVGDVIKEEIGNFLRKHEKLIGWVEDMGGAIGVGVLVYLILYILFCIF